MADIQSQKSDRVIMDLLQNFTDLQLNEQEDFIWKMFPDQFERNSREQDFQKNGEITIFVKHPDNKTTILNVRSYDTIGDVKAKIFQQDQINPDFYQLTFNGEELTESRILFNYQIKNQSTLRLVVKLGSTDDLM